MRCWKDLRPTCRARERARAQQLFYGVVRWSNRLEAALDGLMTHAPRTKVRAVLLVRGSSCWKAALARRPR